MTGILRLRKAALIATGALVASASLVSFAESYRGLYLWASHRGLRGVWAVAWPLQVDVFIAVGELALFVALADGWALRSRALAWTVTVLGLAASVAGNVGHITGTDVASRMTAAVPPLAAAAALTVGLGVLKRVVAAPASAPEAAPETTRAALPSAPRTRRRSAPAKRARTAPVTTDECEREFMTELASGEVPSIRQIRARLHVGQDRARTFRQHLETVSVRT